MNAVNYKNPTYLEALSWLFVIGLFVLPLFHYQELPDQIPSHFDANGKADAYSSKASIWILPIIGTAIFLLLYFLSTAKLFRINAGRKLSPEEEAHKVLQGKKILHALKLIIPASFIYIVYKTIQTALGKSDGLGTAFLIVFLTLVFCVIAYYSWKSY